MDLLQIKKLLFLHERNLYFGRCFLLKNFSSNTEFIFTVKEANEHKFNLKYKIEGTNNLKTIKDYQDYKAVVHFDVDPLDVAKIKLKTKSEKFDQIFHINAMKDRLNLKEVFGVCSLLLKDDGELHMLLNKTQYETLKINDQAKEAGICYKGTKNVSADYCGTFSLAHVKAPEGAAIYIFHLTPKTTPALNEGEMQPVDGLPLLLEDEKVAPKSISKKGSNVDMLDGVAVVRSEKVKDELVSKGNDTELDSRSCAVIHQVRKVNLLDAEKVKDQLVLDGNDIGKD